MKSLHAIAMLVIKEILRKKDFYVAFIFMVLILFYASQMRFFQVGKIYRYLMEVGLSMSFTLSAVIGVCLAARQYPQDLEKRTLWVLLSKPISRWQYVLGKYLGCLIASAACFTVFFLVFMVFALIQSASIDPLTMAQTFYLFFLCLSVVIAMTIGFSFYLSTAANVSISLLCYFLLNAYGPSIASEAAQGPTGVLARAFYYVAPHFEFFDIRARLIHHKPCLDADLVIFLSAYALLYGLAFLGLGMLRFRQKAL